MEDKSYIVYKYTSPSGKSYIGMTSNESRRITSHKYQAEHGPMYKWQHAINKYGFENMKYEVLYSGLSKEEAMKKEIDSISKYDSLNNGYNSTEGGEGCVNRKYKYVMCDSDCNIISVFDSQQEAADAVGVHQVRIGDASKLGKTKTAGGYTWYVVDSGFFNEDVVDSDDDYEIFENFYKNGYLLIRRASAYYGLTQEELKQECAIVFFENPLIMQNYISGDRRIAFREFNRGLANSLSDFSSTGRQIVRNSDFTREVESLQRIHINTEEEVYMEEEIMNKIEIERLKRTYGGEYIDDILEYYEIGADRYCHKHKISNTNARTRIYRKIQKLRNAES